MPSQAEIRRLKRQVAESSHILDHQGLVDFHGHVSARIPGTGRMLIKPVLKAHNQVTARDIIEVDLEAYAAGPATRWTPSQQRGRVIDAPVPPRETMLHVAIMLARPDVGSVVHTHQLIATSIGAGNTPIQALYNQALPFAPETPIFPEPKLITTWDDGKGRRRLPRRPHRRAPARPRRRRRGRDRRPRRHQHDLPGARGHHAGRRQHRRHARPRSRPSTSRSSAPTGTAAPPTPTSTSSRWSRRCRPPGSSQA